MLSGKPAFEGESVGEILAAVVKGEPDWNTLPHGAPEWIRTLLRRCLAKDRKQRLQAIGEARITLGNPSPEPDRPTASATRPRSLAWPLAAGLLALLLAVMAVLRISRQPQAVRPQPLRFQVFAPEKTFVRFLAVSGSGRPRVGFRRTERERRQPGMDPRFEFVAVACVAWNRGSQLHILVAG